VIGIFRCRPPAPQPAAGTFTERLPPTESSGLRRAGRATVIHRRRRCIGNFDFAWRIDLRNLRLVWAFIQAAWVKKVHPESKALLYYGIAVGLFVLMFGGAFMAGVQGQAAAGRERVFLLFRLGGAIMWLVAAFNMRSSIEEHFNSALSPSVLSL